MTESYSLAELAEAVNGWCETHGVIPANGQSGELLSERNLRYYRSMGLVDPPLAGGGQGYGEKHRLQVVAIRLLQAQGLPLNRIRELLFGRDVAELRQVERQGLQELTARPVAAFRPNAGETWSVCPLDDDFLLISRRGRAVSAGTRDEILEILNRAGSSRRPQSLTKKGSN